MSSVRMIRTCIHWRRIIKASWPAYTTMPLRIQAILSQISELFIISSVVVPSSKARSRTTSLSSNVLSPTVPAWVGTCLMHHRKACRVSNPSITRPDAWVLYFIISIVLVKWSANFSVLRQFPNRLSLPRGYNITTIGSATFGISSGGM